MARSTQTEQDQINAIIAALRTPASGLSITDRLENVLVDTVADSALFASRVAAAGEAAVGSFGDGFALERERQLKRRAERILRASQQ